MEKYKAISEAITKKVSSLKHPNSFQLDLRVNFPKYIDYWWMYDVESILLKLEYKPHMEKLEIMEPEYFTGENQCEEPWKFTRKELMIDEGNLYFDGFRMLALIKLRLQKIGEKCKREVRYTFNYNYETYWGMKEKLKSMDEDEKILEDGIHEMAYRMNGRDLSIRLKDWRKRISQNPFKGMSKEFARDVPQEFFEYFDTAMMDFRRWIEEIING